MLSKYDNLSNLFFRHLNKNKNYNFLVVGVDLKRKTIDGGRTKKRINRNQKKNSYKRKQKKSKRQKQKKSKRQKRYTHRITL
jgi:Icc-related predicted phosphoesterase